MGAESGPPPAACLLPPGRRQCRSWLGSRGGPCDWWGRKSRLLRAALAGTAVLLSKPFISVAEAEPHAPLPRPCCHGRRARESLCLSGPTCRMSRRAGSHPRHWAYLDVLRGLARPHFGGKAEAHRDQAARPVSQPMLWNLPKVSPLPLPPFIRHLCSESPPARHPHTLSVSAWGFP